jgi:hypothetical protein
MASVHGVLLEDRLLLRLLALGLQLLSGLLCSGSLVHDLPDVAAEAMQGCLTGGPLENTMQ